LGLFRRYSELELRVRGPGLPLLDERGDTLGYVDHIEISGHRLKVTGWTYARAVSLVAGSERSSTRPNVLREDAGLTDSRETLRVDFELSIPGSAAGSMLCLQVGREPSTSFYYYSLPGIPAARVRVARLGVAVRFLGRTIIALPAVIAWIRTRSPSSRERILRVLGLAERRELPKLQAEQLISSRSPAPVPGDAKITVILPVYNAYDLLVEVLDRVERNTDLDWHMLIVEDCSTDARIRPFLREWCGVVQRTQRVELFENDENLGFIASVNRAFSRASMLGNHVVLLNSDALVPKAWASRLLAPILADRQVASVTPMSNDAEILSVPVIGRRRVLSPGQGDAIDGRARELDGQLNSADLPTGVGFCMAVSSRFLEMVGHFDESLGKGYGEEVDWCQRARRAGGRHVGIGSLFVEHRGGESFGSEAKRALIQKNNAVIAGRYPRYDAEVEEFGRTDPLVSSRLALAVAMADQVHRRTNTPALPIYLAHSMGGGAEHYLQERLARDVADGGFAVVLRVGSEHARWQLELITDTGSVDAGSDSFNSIVALLGPLSRRRIVYSCGVGHPDADELPGLLIKLKKSHDDLVEVVFHDYFPVSPSYTLITSGGTYGGLPKPDNSDPAHRFTRSDGQTVDLPEWRRNWTELIRAADEIVVFSNDSRSIVAEVWPEFAEQIILRPHGLRSTIRPARRVASHAGPAERPPEREGEISASSLSATSPPSIPCLPPSTSTARISWRSLGPSSRSTESNPG
jgi:GT2 family glycosyltransferase